MTDVKKNWTPCVECPFRKKSAPGWLGAHQHASELTDMVNADRPFPCHMKVNRLVHAGGRSFEGAVAEAEHCAGALAFMNNSCKRSRDKKIAQAQEIVGKREDCFSRASEMWKHHEG